MKFFVTIICAVSFAVTSYASDVEEKIKEIVVRQLGLHPCDVSEEGCPGSSIGDSSNGQSNKQSYRQKSFVNDWGAVVPVDMNQSNDLVELFNDIEKEFDIVIPDPDRIKLTNIEQLINYVVGKKNSHQQ